MPCCAEPPQAADRGLDPLARHHPAELEDEPLIRIEAQGDPGRRLLDGPELAGIKAAGDDRDLLGVGIVKPDQVLLVLRTLGDDPVGLGDDPVLDRQPLLGKAVGLKMVKPAHPAKGVEGHHEGRTQHRLDIGSHQARHEEVGM